uniref:cdc42 homolog n=1 Tax=Styela clava TaxID=7725 RepID=UPI0019396892|nr:cdc42 homolog [Styela clava]
MFKAIDRISNVTVSRPTSLDNTSYTDVNRNSCKQVLRKTSEMAPEAHTRFGSQYKELPASSPDVIPNSEKNEFNRETRLKCVLLGDGAVGKTSLVVSYTTNGYPTEYIPTAFDNYSVRIQVNENPVRLQLCDTAGQDEFDHLRPLCYAGTDVFIVCFSVVRPTSFHNIREKWWSEIKRHHPKTPVVLVGTQSDLRSSVDVLIDLARFSEKPVSEEEIQQLAHDIGAVRYVECSALTQKNLKEVFDTSIVEAMERHERTLRKNAKKSRSFLHGGSREKAQRKAKEMRRISVAWWKKYCCMA